MFGLKEIVPWKSHVYQEITPVLLQNKRPENTSVKSSMRAQPIKHYRREIASVITSRGNRRNIKLGSFETPGGSVTSKSSLCTGITHVLAPNTALDGCNSNAVTCGFTAKNALKRVRSSGMPIRNKYDASLQNRQTYYANDKERLQDRNKSYEQNQFHFFRQGDSTANPGSVAAIGNQYAPGGTNHCPLTLISEENNNNTFKYVWIDGTEHLVTIPSNNYYDIDLISNVFKNAMLANEHYLLTTQTHVCVFLMQMVFNRTIGQIQLELSLVNSTLYPTTHYEIPIGVSWSLPETNIVPQIIILNNNFSSCIGLIHGTYPLGVITNGIQSPVYTKTQFVNGSFGSLKPKWRPMVYKPNNPQFAQQGGVTASSLIHRKKYNTIQTSAYRTGEFYGPQTASALSYSVSNGRQSTIKDRNAKFIYTPKLSTTGEAIECRDTKIH